MKTPDVSSFSIGPRLTLTFAILIALILGGNGLLLWQFHTAHLQTDRLSAVNQQVISVLRLQESLVSAHERLDELAKTRDAHRLSTEAEPLRRALLEEAETTRNAVTRLPPQARMDPALLPTLDAIEITLPSQLEAVTALAASGDWEAVRLRLDNEFKPLETRTAALVANIDQEVSGELRQADANMRDAQLKILFLVPATAITTFFIAAFLGWAVTRRITELRLEERITERTRIARELHDTLLQGFISASIHLQIAMDKLPEESPAKPLLVRALLVTEQVIEEGRNTVRGFRSTTAETRDLEMAFSRVPLELDFGEQIDFRVMVEGDPQSLHPVIRDEVYSIGREAVVNAFRHSGATRIKVELQYSASQLRVLVSDEGCGIDQQVLEAGRVGHWGLSGMRERAQRIGASLKFVSRNPGGTQVELSVPSNIAFVSSRLASKRFASMVDRPIATNQPWPKPQQDE
jgi:signal transduction histidine kinase